MSINEMLDGVLEKGGKRPSLVEDQAAELEAAGMKGAALALREKAERKRKLMLAYEHYRFVRPEKIEAYRKRLNKSTMKRLPLGGHEYMDLAFTPLERYEKVPPGEVLTKLKEARAMGCFDRFEVAHVVARKEVPDPIVFGRVDGCEDRFFVAQWDSDIRIEDILLPAEG